MSFEVYIQFGSIEPGLLKKGTERYLQSKGLPVDSFASLTDARRLEKQMAEMFFFPIIKKRIVELRRPEKQKARAFGLQLQRV